MSYRTNNGRGGGGGHTSSEKFLEANSDESDAENVEQQIGAEAKSTLPRELAIHIDLIASPAELAQTLESNVWKLLPHLSKELKQNMAMKNRHLAGPDQLAGNLNRCIPLHLQIVQQKNSFPYAMGIHMTGMMDTTLHRHGQALWRVPPDTPTMMVGLPAFEPKTKINKYMYSNYRMCTLEDLDTDVKRVEASSKKPAHYNVLVGSLAYETLLDSLDNGAWQDQIEHIEVDHVYDPGRSHSVTVTEKMGKELRDMMREPIEEAAEAFINLEEFKVTITRADGDSDFVSPKQLHGELVGSELLEGSNLNSDRLQKRCCFHVSAELTYILF
jgi:hypothetical protein